MTKIISGFPCIGKTTIGNSNKFKYNDIEFRETAAQRGMSELDKEKLFDNYANIIELIYKSNYYDYLFVTDNYKLIDNLIERNIEFTYVVPDIKDINFAKIYKERVLARNNLDWYNNVISPKLEILEYEINKVKNYPKANILLLDTKHPLLKNLIF
jgi:hypothetical protein